MSNNKWFTEMYLPNYVNLSCLLVGTAKSNPITLRAMFGTCHGHPQSCWQSAKAACSSNLLRKASAESNFLWGLPSYTAAMTNNTLRISLSIDWLLLALVKWARFTSIERKWEREDAKLPINPFPVSLQTKHCFLLSRWWSSVRKSLSPFTHFLACCMSQMYSGKASELFAFWLRGQGCHLTKKCTAH